MEIFLHKFLAYHSFHIYVRKLENRQLHTFTKIYQKIIKINLLNIWTLFGESLNLEISFVINLKQSKVSTLKILHFNQNHCYDENLLTFIQFEVGYEKNYPFLATSPSFISFMKFWCTRVILARAFRVIPWIKFLTAAAVITQSWGHFQISILIWHFLNVVIFEKAISDPDCRIKMLILENSPLFWRPVCFTM